MVIVRATPNDLVRNIKDMGTTGPINFNKINKSIDQLRWPYHPEFEITNCEDIKHSFLPLNSLINIEKYIKDFKNIINFDKYTGARPPASLAKIQLIIII